MDKREFELLWYFQALNNRKWLILLGSLACMIVALIVGFLVTPVYEVDALVQAGKIFVYDQAGNLKEFVIEEPLQIADKIRHRSYDAMTAVELDIAENELPRINATSIRNTLLVRIWTRDQDVDLAKKAMGVLFDQIKTDIDAKIDIELNFIDALIRKEEINGETFQREIEIEKKKLKILSERKKDLLGEIDTLGGKIQDLEEERSKALRLGGRSETASLGMLLYSNEIQQSLRYQDLLNEKLSAAKMEEEDVNSRIQTLSGEVLKIETSIASLRERKGRIDYTKLIKQPTRSLSPVAPKKLVNMGIAFLVGLAFFSVWSIFRAYLEDAKADAS